ncbi:hypothetical protein LTR67_003584 [Exophiala xenobiotica]
MHFSITTGVVLLLQILFVGCDQAQTPLRSGAATKCRPHRIAIIGAGPGGSSASYHLEKFAQSSSLDVPLDITVFDSNPYIGGRTTTVNALDDPRYPTELGASIFVKINHILYNATRDFELIPSFRNHESAAPDAKYELGIWDGTQFVFKTAHEEDDDDDGTSSSWRGWWDIAKLLWRYGLSPIRTQRATRAALGSFLKFYDNDNNDGVFPFASLQDAVDSTGLAAYTSLTGKEVLKNAGVSAMFGREIIQASTRVNYASNLGGIHGLETFVCMAIEGAMAVDGGNWQIFERMVKESAARVFLNTSVTDVSRSVKTDTAGFARGRYHLRTTDPDLNEYLNADRDMGMQPDGDGDGDGDNNGERDTAGGYGFDTVIIAAPLQFSNLSFTPALVNPPETIPYTSLYVTLLTSPHRLAPKFFGLDRPEDVPSSVITTLPESLDDQLGSRHDVDGVGPAGFWSVSTLRVLRPGSDCTFSVRGLGLNTSSAATEKGEEAENEEEGQTQTQYLYKIFSPAPLTATFLSGLLGFDLEDFPTFPTSRGGSDGSDGGDGGDDNDDDRLLSQLSQLSQLPKKDITWLHEKMWHSYPYELPRTTFDNFTLAMDMPMPAFKGGGEEEQEKDEGMNPQEQGLYYLSSMESLISTMETSALAASPSHSLSPNLGSARKRNIPR